MNQETQRLNVTITFNDLAKMTRVRRTLEKIPGLIRVDFREYGQSLHGHQKHRTTHLLEIIGSEEINTGRLYWKARKQGMNTNYKTLQRDLAVLILDGKVIATKQTGLGGNTTLLKRRVIE